MKRSPTEQTLERLNSEKNIWMATMRPKGARPHLVPVWFAWHEEAFFMCMRESSVKAKNLQSSDEVVLALEDGSDVVICEGDATKVEEPYSAEMLAIFKQKYDWDIPSDVDYNLVIKVTPEKWMIWGDEGNYA